MPGTLAGGGKLPPLPAPGEVGVGVGVGDEPESTVILSVAVAVLLACCEVAVTVNVMSLPARAVAAVSSACVSTWSPPLRPDTEHVTPPVGWQTEKVGLTLVGDAASPTVAVPPLPLVSQTKMANCTVPPGFTVVLLPRV